MPANLFGFFQAFTVNLRLGLVALLIGLVLGLLTAVIRCRTDGFSARFIGFLIGVLRAFPVYVLMFVAASIFSTMSLFNAYEAEFSASIAVIVALLAYTVSACSDACVTFLNFRARGQLAQAWLVVPNVFQIFVITVMASSIGAALGVQEAVAFTLSLAQTYEMRIERIGLIICVIVFFAGILMTSRFLVARAIHTILRRRIPSL
jgi:ABC-type amino acid transport system permease subunit